MSVCVCPSGRSIYESWRGFVRSSLINQQTRLPWNVVWIFMMSLDKFRQILEVTWPFLERHFQIKFSPKTTLECMKGYLKNSWIRSKIRCEYDHQRINPTDYFDLLMFFVVPQGRHFHLDKNSIKHFGADCRELYWANSYSTEDYRGHIMFWGFLPFLYYVMQYFCAWKKVCKVKKKPKVHAKGSYTLP